VRFLTAADRLVGGCSTTAVCAFSGRSLQWPRWSPDETGIAYSNGSSVYVVDVKTGDTTKVALGGQPAWRDGNTVIFSH